MHEFKEKSKLLKMPVPFKQQQRNIAEFVRSAEYPLPLLSEFEHVGTPLISLGVLQHDFQTDALAFPSRVATDFCPN